MGEIAKVSSHEFQEILLYFYSKCNKVNGLKTKELIEEMKEVLKQNLIKN